MIRFPDIWYAADRASIRSKRLLFSAKALQFLSAIGIASAEVIQPRSGSYFPLREAAVVIGLLFVAEIFTQVIVSALKVDRTWYYARAVSETVKSLCWRFVLAEGYLSGPDDEATRRFLTLSRETAERGAHALGEEYPLSDLRLKPTESMMSLRHLSLPERLEAFIQQRLSDQANWYTNKSQMNGQLALRFRVISLMFQLSGLALAVTTIVSGTEYLGFTGVAATAIAATVGWAEARQYADLQEQYGRTATELNTIWQKISHVTSMSDRLGLATDAENVISREHRMWLIHHGQGQHLPPTIETGH